MTEKKKTNILYNCQCAFARGYFSFSYLLKYILNCLSMYTFIACDDCVRLFHVWINCTLSSINVCEMNFCCFALARVRHRSTLLIESTPDTRVIAPSAQALLFIVNEVQQRYITEMSRFMPQTFALPHPYSFTQFWLINEMPDKIKRNLFSTDICCN